MKKKKTAVICLFVGCLLLGIVIAGVFRETNRQYPYVKPTIPGGVTVEEKEEAIRIALSNESVKEKIEGLEYEVRDVLAFEKWMTGEKLDTDDVYIHIKGTPICYIAIVNLTERRVIAISESICGPVDDKRIKEVVEIALNESRVKEKIKGKVKGKDYDVSVSDKLVGKKLQTDVYIRIKEPLMTIRATVDPEEGKVIRITESHGLF